MTNIEHDIEDNKALLQAMFITQRRMYDVLALILKQLSPEEADAIISDHDAGLFATPPPKYAAGADE